MRGSLLLSLIAIMACASTGSAPVQQRDPERQTVRVEGVGAVTLTSTTTTNVQKMPYAIDKVWQVLPAVYDSLGIPVTTLLPAEHTIGNEGFKARQKLGKTSLSRYLSCGETQMGPSADSYEINISVVTVAKPSGSETTLETTVEATARPLNFSQVPSRCSSRATLESRVVELAQKLAAR